MPDEGCRDTVSYTTHSSLLREVRAGSESAWNEFYRKYAGMIRAVGHKLQLTPEECDDLLVEVMLIFWKKMDNFFYDPKRGHFRSYLSKISRFVALRLFRSRISRSAIGDETPTDEYPEEIDTKYMDEWRDFLLKQALDELKDAVDTETFQVFYMSVFQKRNAAEISAVTRKSINNIYVIRSRCIKKIQKIIAGYREGEEAELMRHSQRNIQEL